jgi:hypothetical protein
MMMELLLHDNFSVWMMLVVVLPLHTSGCQEQRVCCCCLYWMLLMPRTAPGGLLNLQLQELQSNHINFTINPLHPSLNGTLQVISHIYTMILQRCDRDDSQCIYLTHESAKSVMRQLLLHKPKQQTDRIASLSVIWPCKHIHQNDCGLSLRANYINQATASWRS